MALSGHFSHTDSVKVETSCLEKKKQKKKKKGLWKRETLFRRNKLRGKRQSNVN